MMLKHALFLFPLFLFHFSCDMQESSRPSNVEPLEWLDEGVYQIINRHSQLALDVARISREDGANVLQFKPKSSDNQKFRVTPLSNGYYSIRPLHSNKSIEVYEASRSAGGQVRQWYYHGADHQQWDIKALKVATSR
ncbi:RICIN domain-containing protein [Pseudobacteriovorax antillogorgiicola]|uniref:Ricin-type beta-trefoil lectin domain-like n=1 Tax=Pseudobacteriovorax antillogorgiicola TaxID=1513793 RepID=A0A1Y6CQ86_9BACT|nr:RICIN domain-containing protein [Pseudobacteriovorax antillogorgiicola]TCS42125.1 ricin-type beta-trefoil lectin protein [Pseudobacteriovorax antillogorgiicola]SMF82983.1 Ricin-type beta-trefoil lectin domain-like [Pseudobacteriovorax antillogorgiicola]